ncbi:hypothetical protein [Miltoncostaea marina]|uniref:hypothetical protein n=1 Tax=Miltoncostaea marina TaxID=2843215 RepID=UPI001C3C58F8|nr:hypothetical protein [Miltoncostaea marina]
MSTLVVEGLVGALVAGRDGRGLAVVPRRRRRGRWATVAADDVVAALEAAGPGAVVLARPAGDDPGAAALPQVARLMSAPLLRLPGAAPRAAWAVAVALHPAFEGHRGVRSLEALLSAGAGARVPALRPRVMSRWAAAAWRPCGRCPGGGLPGCPCGRCGAAVAGGRR